MGRTHVIQHWSDAAEYSGEIIGNRLSKSEALHFNRNGSANTALYADEPVKRKSKPKAPIQSRIIPQNVTLNRLDSQEEELEQAFDDGTVDLETYVECKRVLDAKRERAIKALNKALGREQELPATLAHPERENVSTGLFSLTNSMFESIAEGVNKNQANKPKNSLIEDFKILFGWALIINFILVVLPL